MSMTVRLSLDNARTGRREELGELRIVNDASGSIATGNYDVMFRPRPHGAMSRTARVVGWERRQPPWALVAEAIRALSLDKETR